MSVNKCIIIGHIGQSPELKYTTSGQAVCNLRIATSEKFTSKDGNKQEKTEWHNVVLFGTTAENASKYLGKGSQVFIEGKIQTRSWQDKSGDTRYTTEIIANEMRFLDSKSDSKPSNQADSYKSRIDFVNAEKAKLRANDPEMSYNRPSDINSEDIPF